MLQGEGPENVKVNFLKFMRSSVMNQINIRMVKNLKQILKFYILESLKQTDWKMRLLNLLKLGCRLTMYQMKRRRQMK